MMSPSDKAKANANVTAINAMSNEELFTSFRRGHCPYEPQHLIGVPVGMFHCPVCGIMVVAGMKHPEIVWKGDFETGWADFSDGMKKGETIKL